LPRIYTELHGKEGKEPLSVIFASAEIHIYSKARMDPRIREGDQGANKRENQGIFTAKTHRAQRKIRMDPRIREGDQGSRQVIQAFMLLLGVLCVFAVKILGFSGVLQRKARNQLARVFAAMRCICHGLTRNCTENSEKNPFPSFSRMRKSIFTARQEWTPAYARVTKARIRRKIKAFSPRRRKERKEKQE